MAWKSDDGPNHAGVITFHYLDDDKTRVTAQIEVHRRPQTGGAAQTHQLIDRSGHGVAS